VKTAVVVAGAFALALNVAPSAMAVAGTMHKSGVTVNDPGPRGERGERGEPGDPGPRGPEGPAGPSGYADTYVRTDPSPTTDLVPGTSVATCADNNDEVVGGGYLVGGPLVPAANVIESRPVDTAPDEWHVTAAGLLTPGQTLTAYIVCARVPGV
jgi:hypothetical protein